MQVHEVIQWRQINKINVGVTQWRKINVEFIQLKNLNRLVVAYQINSTNGRQIKVPVCVRLQCKTPPTRGVTSMNSPNGHRFDVSCFVLHETHIIVWYDVPVQPGMVRARHNVTYKFDHDSSGNGNRHHRNVCWYSELRCERFKRVMSVTTLIFQLLLCCVWCRDST